MNNLNRQYGDEAVYPGHDQWAASTETRKVDSVELSSERRQEIIDTLADAITNSQLDLSYKITPESAHIAERYPTYYHVVDDGSESPEPPNTPDAPNGAPLKSEPGEFGELEPKNVPSNNSLSQMNTVDPGSNGGPEALASQNTSDSSWL